MNNYKKITQVEAKKIMDNEDCTILDVRTPEEFNEGHIDGAINIPLNCINEEAENILTDKNETILVYCRSGVRSKDASFILAKKGYNNILEFGGIIDWIFDIVL